MKASISELPNTSYKTTMHTMFEDNKKVLKHPGKSGIAPSQCNKARERNEREMEEIKLSLFIDDMIIQHIQKSTQNSYTNTPRLQCSL